MKEEGGDWCQKNETALIHWAQLYMQVTGGKSVFTRFYLSLLSFLLQVIIGTPPAPTMPGGLLLVDSQTTGSANHPPCSTPLSLYFPTLSCLLFTCISSSPARTHSFSRNYSLLNNSFLLLNSTLHFGNLRFCSSLYKCQKSTLTSHISFRVHLSVFH